MIHNQYKYIKKCNIDNIDIQVGDLFRINQTSHYRGIYKYHNYIEIFNHRKQCIYTIGIITDTSKFNTRTKKIMDLLNGKITFVIHDSFCSMTTKQVNKIMKTVFFENDYLLTTNKNNLNGNFINTAYFGRINTFHISIIDIIIRQGTKDQTRKIISYKSNLTYNILIKTNKPNTLIEGFNFKYLFYASLLAALFSNPILIPVAYQVLNKIQSTVSYLSTFKDESKVFNCIKISYLFFKSPRELLHILVQNKPLGNNPEIIYNSNNNNNNNTANVFYNAVGNNPEIIYNSNNNNNNNTANVFYNAVEKHLSTEQVNEIKNLPKNQVNKINQILRS